jgi:hypothetical protein
MSRCPHRSPGTCSLPSTDLSNDASEDVDPTNRTSDAEPGSAGDFEATARSSANPRPRLSTLRAPCFSRIAATVRSLAAILAAPASSTSLITTRHPKRMTGGARTAWPSEGDATAREARTKNTSARIVESDRLICNSPQGWFVIPLKLGERSASPSLYSRYGIECFSHIDPLFPDGPVCSWVPTVVFGPTLFAKSASTVAAPVGGMLAPAPADIPRLGSL